MSEKIGLGSDDKKDMEQSPKREELKGPHYQGQQMEKLTKLSLNLRSSQEAVSFWEEQSSFHLENIKVLKRKLEDLIERYGRERVRAVKAIDQKGHFEREAKELKEQIVSEQMKKLKEKEG